MSLANIHNQLIAQEAHIRGITCMLLVPETEDILVLEKDHRVIYINKTRSHKLSSMAGLLSKNKAACNTLLLSQGIPVPPFLLVKNMDVGAVSFLETHQPLVVKPYDTDRSAGVYMCIQTQEWLQKAITEVCRISGHAMLQQQASGYDYRVLVIDEKVEAVLWNQWPAVTGDGIASISELIVRENQRREQLYVRIGDHVIMDPIPLNERIKYDLSTQQLRLEDVPAAGQRIFVSFCGNAWAGAVPVDVTDDIHPDNKELAIRAAACLQIDVAGIDIRCADIARSWKDGGFAVIEVNVLPSMFEHVFPAAGKSRNVIGAYLTYLFK